jgi:hypothetical protein
MSHDPPAATSWNELGPHLYRIEDDTLYVQTHGDATLESTILYNDLCKQLIERNGYVLSIIDLRVAGSAPPEARRYQAQAAKEFPPGCSEIAIYGMNRFVSTFIQLTARAASLLTGREAGIVFLRDEAAALRWRDERRAVLRARCGRSRPA